MLQSTSTAFFTWECLLEEYLERDILLQGTLRSPPSTTFPLDGSKASCSYHLVGALTLVSKSVPMTLLDLNLCSAR